MKLLLRRTFKGDIWSVERRLLRLCLGGKPPFRWELATQRSSRVIWCFVTAGRVKSSIRLVPETALSMYLLKTFFYADDEKVCWLWNHRDTRDASLSETTKKALFLSTRRSSTESGKRTRGTGVTFFRTRKDRLQNYKQRDRKRRISSSEIF